MNGVDGHEPCGQCAASGSVQGFDVVPSSPEMRGLLEEIFTDRFMAKYTNFETFESFRYSSAVVVNWESDVLIYARERLDAIVRESTQFSSWEEMVRSAADLRYGPSGDVPDKDE